jgi:hypothetical protein
MECSIYFSYAIFLIDYKKIFKIAGRVKQLTVPLLPDPRVSLWLAQNFFFGPVKN